MAAKATSIGITERVCVSVAGESVAAALALAERVATQADVIEIRLDFLHEIRVAPFLAALDKPLLFTNRPLWEGGKFAGSEEDRLVPLLKAATSQAAYVDIELKAPESSRARLIANLQGSATRLILSWHNFEHTPDRPELLVNLQMMQDAGAHIGKIVTMAHDFRDVLRVLALQEDAARIGLPLIAFCMGAPGTISRLATLDLGGYMTYCSADEGAGTAPGQISIATLRDILRRLRK